jgi:hypothetical protein
MKPIRLIGTGALFLLLGIGAPAYARQDKPDDHGGAAAKPAQQQAKPTQQGARPAQQQQAKPAEQHAAPAPRQQPAAKPAARQQPAAKPAAARQQTAAKPVARPQQARATTAAKPAARSQQARTTTAARPAARQAQQPAQAKQQTNSAQRGNVQRTAAEQQTQRSQPAVRESGRTSTRIPTAQYNSNFGSGHRFRMGNPEMVGGYSRFQYGGFWFGFVQPWPADWYYTDDVYIVFVDGGYYMYDPYYPGSRIEISVVM